jgi:hypothetical protein
MSERQDTTWILQRRVLCAHKSARGFPFAWRAKIGLGSSKFSSWVSSVLCCTCWIWTSSLPSPLRTCSSVYWECVVYVLLVCLCVHGLCPDVLPIRPFAWNVLRICPQKVWGGNISGKWQGVVKARFFSCKFAFVCPQCEFLHQQGLFLDVIVSNGNREWKGTGNVYVNEFRGYMFFWLSYHECCERVRVESVGECVTRRNQIVLRIECVRWRLKLKRLHC